MNIVKGVANLIRRTSSGHSGEYGPGSQSGRFSSPTPRVRFSEVGAILKTLWGRYVNATDEVEKRKFFNIFLKQFLTVFQNWKPVDPAISPEEALTDLPIGLTEYSQHTNDVADGCYFGHPPEIILTLTEEVAKITKLLTDSQVGIATSMDMKSEAWLVLDALSAVTRSIHNCKVVGYYAGIQKLTALMKASVVQLKTIASALSAEETLLNTMVENAGILQKILVCVVSIIFNFIDLQSNIEENVQFKSTNPEHIRHETILSWHQTAVISVMVAGGLNWLLEILRVIRRLNMKEQWTDMSLHDLTLRALRSALDGNPRGQNHFRSIGSLEVLLDGFGFPSVDSLIVIFIGAQNHPRRQNLPFLFEHVFTVLACFCSLLEPKMNRDIY